MADTPFELVHDALWNMLEAHTRFTALVPAGNRVKLTVTRGQQSKPRTNTADYPEVRIIPVGGTPHLQRTSSSSTIEKRWEIQVASGENHVAVMFELEWEIYRALAKWATHLASLKWPVVTGEVFIVHSRVSGFQEGIRDGDFERGLSHWTSVWACNTLMVFQTSVLQA